MPGNNPQVLAEVVVFDLEFTAWEGSMAHRWLAPGQFREIVQIGAVRVDTRTLAESASFMTLVRPRLNSSLSAYFERLTGITNAALSHSGIDLVEAHKRFVVFSGNAPAYAFGRDDQIFEENFRLYGLANPFTSQRYRNIAPWLRANGLDPRHAGDVAEAAGAGFAGQKHDALYDARSVAAGIRALMARGAKNPFTDEECN